MYHKRAFVIALGLLVGTLGACTKNPQAKKDPKEHLKEYISQSFAVDALEDRRTLERFLTGDAKIRLAAWSDEEFAKNFVSVRRQFLKLVFLDTEKGADQEQTISYELTFLDQSKNTKITQKKKSTLVWKSDQWLIQDVRSISELIEYQNELTLP